MWSRKQVHVIGSIYDAALDETRWPAALIELSEAMGCKQCNFALIDRRSETVNLLTPMWDDAMRRDFFGHWQKQFSLVKRTEHLRPGQVFTYADLVDLSWFKSTPVFNEWWRPQGMGGGSLGSNLLNDAGVTALVTVHRSYDKVGFSPEEKSIFAKIVTHLTRAITIQRRLRLAVSVTGLATPTLPSGLLVVDSKGYVLDGDHALLAQFHRLGLLVNRREGSIIQSKSGKMERLIHAAACLQTADHIDVPDDRADGESHRIDVFPCSIGERDSARLITIDRPAAVLSVTSGRVLAEQRGQRLMAAYGLTTAEAAVAVNIARGDGRAAVAARLKISQSTVRSHLTAVFAKTGVHRQAELAVLVSEV